eukprot:CAMPEP_0185741062 /NCGR_PEP_ID=MMETSP1171-20130828/38756_1 /TAXON_ID=374046 /ORGANISM="Helicotheca tamensis, Strain CCMP826" /LENGTH=680 /DNA_ID=CAMNT_0028413003 /DNA_START=1 /DNA_END=2043 /DNA_ORIENTATION=-
MKISLHRQELVYFFLLLPSLASAGGNSASSLPTTITDIVNFDNAADDPSGSCLGSSDFHVAYSGRGGCSYDTLAEYIGGMLPLTCGHNGTEELKILLGGGTKNETVARAALSQVCFDGFNAYEGTYPWSSVTGYGPEWDKEYYDGNTYWNEEHQTNYDTLVEGEPANVLRTDARQLKYLFDAEARSEAIEFPDFIDNFESCDLRSAMCCWVSDRQANDNNGNCATPYDENCRDADPGDNTDLCAVDMDRTTSSSSHVDGGFALFHGNNEGPVHCHGFAWGQDVNEPAARFKGNNLFFVSMYDHLHQRGYVREVPGAPMCACVEKMPIVSRADCTEIEEDETWLFTWSSSQYQFTASLESIKIKFNACRGANNRNNDLEAFYRRLANEGRASEAEFDEFKKTVVGNHQCDNAINALLEEKGYVYDPDPYVEGLTQVYGKGEMVPVEQHLLRPLSAFTKQGDIGLRHLLGEHSPVFYVVRWCPRCQRSHRMIVYKRLTAIPEDMDFYTLFTERWLDYPENVNHLDFTLHSSLEEAFEDKNPWSFCNYHEHVGFPRDCGPYGFVGGQWSSPNGGQQDVAFYVWNGNPDITDPARPHPDIPNFTKSSGFCLNANGNDQNSGVYQLEGGDFETEELQTRCLKLCAAYPGYTGCEAIWGQHNRGCYVHTKDVSTGNGAGNHMCWVL